MTVTPDLPDRPAKSKIKIIMEEPGKLSVHIPREGFSLRGFFTLLFNVFWMFMIVIWSILLMQFGYIWLLASVPFWALAITIFILSVRMIFSSQTLTINHRELLLLKKQNGKTAHAIFDIRKIESIGLVEGTYKTLTGITRRGTYPAIIYNKEAFGFGERCRSEEKRWLIDLLNNFIATKITPTS
ncbi:MAG: hypothetical protein KUL83_09520 [Lentimicrobium sp.]|nr:hypothetical protein [Lentimicrobium sp.]